MDKSVTYKHLDPAGKISNQQVAAQTSNNHDQDQDSVVQRSGKLTMFQAMSFRYGALKGARI